VHYKVGAFNIKSECAAKPIVQASGVLLRCIERIQPVQQILDYGCGKLRYASALARKCQCLTLVDSAEQLDKTQKIAGAVTTVRQYATKRWPHAKAISVEEFEEAHRKFDVILCANVLSAIPARVARSRCLRLLADSLEIDGKCLFVSQYTNSYFTHIRTSKNAVEHLDGWILQTQRGDFYFGILGKEKLSRLISRHGFAVLKSWVEGQSAYVLAEKKNPGIAHVRPSQTRRG
jgi:hypothetical protein